MPDQELLMSCFLMLGNSFVGELAEIGVLLDADEMSACVETGNRRGTAADAVIEHDGALVGECPNQILEEFDRLG